MLCTKSAVSAMKRTSRQTIARAVFSAWLAAPTSCLVQSSHAAYDRLGLADRFRLLSAAECAERVRITKVHGGLYTKESASIHAGRLVRGLAAAVERRGGLIYENTEVTGVRDGTDARLTTPAGELRAKRTIILAGEAYLTRLRRFHRVLLPMYSLISLTEPLTESQWARIRWRNHESLASNRSTVDYLTRTADGRILFGSRGAPYRFASRISNDQDIHEPTHSRIHQAVVEWFPSLRGIKFTHNWGGPVGVPRDWMPAVFFDADARIAMILGYTGQGVATSNLSGRLLASLVNESSPELGKLPLAQRRSPNWEIEPLRWLVVRYTQKAFMSIDEAAEARTASAMARPNRAETWQTLSAARLQLARKRRRGDSSSSSWPSIASSGTGNPASTRVRNSRGEI